MSSHEVEMNRVLSGSCPRCIRWKTKAEMWGEKCVWNIETWSLEVSFSIRSIIRAEILTNTAEGEVFEFENLKFMKGQLQIRFVLRQWSQTEALLLCMDYIDISLVSESLFKFCDWWALFIISWPQGPGHASFKGNQLRKQDPFKPQLKSIFNSKSS